MYLYETLQMKAISPSHGPYGILCKQKQNKSWVPVVVAAPFSGDMDTVTALAEKCTRLQLSPEHLIDVVSDFISQTDLIT